RRLVEVGQTEQRRAHERREHQQRRRHDQHGRELDDEQVRPHVDLVLRLGARLLDRARFDDREQPLRVTAGAGGRRGRLGRGRGGGRATAGGRSCGGRRRRRAAVPAIAGERCPAPLRPLEQVGGNAARGRRGGGVLAFGGGRRVSGRGRRRLGGLLAGRRGFGRRRGFLVALFAGHGQAQRLAALPAAAEQVLGNFGHRSLLIFRAARRGRRPCGRARSGRP